MKKLILFALTSLLLLLGCQSDPLDFQEGIKKEVLSFQEFIDIQGFLPVEEGYLYEGDILFSPDEVDRLYMEAKDNRGNIAADPETQRRYIWTGMQSRDITYRFVGSMATGSLTDQQVRSAFRAAAGRWSATSLLNFREVVSGGNFYVRTVDVATGYVAAAFFPNSSYEPIIRLNLRYVDNTYTTLERMTGLFTHELGHAIGLAHEHQRTDSPNNYGQGSFGESFGVYDGNSVMDYGNRPYLAGISNGDRALAVFLYGENNITVPPKPSLSREGVYSGGGVNVSRYSWSSPGATSYQFDAKRFGSYHTIYSGRNTSFTTTFDNVRLKACNSAGCSEWVYYN